MPAPVVVRAIALKSNVVTPVPVFTATVLAVVLKSQVKFSSSPSPSPNIVRIPLLAVTFTPDVELMSKGPISFAAVKEVPSKVALGLLVKVSESDQ